MKTIDISKVVKDGKLWLNKRIYFNDNNIRKLCNLKIVSFKNGTIRHATSKGKLIHPNLIHRILSHSGFYFNLDTSELVIESHGDKEIEGYLKGMFDKKYTKVKLKCKYMSFLSKAKDLYDVEGLYLDI